MPGNQTAPEAPGRRAAPLAALLCAAASLFLARGGIVSGGLLTLVFLTPLGFAGRRFGPRAAWGAFGLAVTANVVFTLGTTLLWGLDLGEALWDLFYFTAMSGVFAWIAAPMPEWRFCRVPGPARMAAGSLICGAVFMGIYHRAMSQDAFRDAVREQIAAAAALYQTVDVVTPDLILAATRILLLRGGALASSALVLWINLQAGRGLARLFGAPARGRGKTLREFHVHPRVIWALSLAIVLAAAAGAFRLEIPGIAAWNVIALCALLYLAQGIGILQHFLSARRPVLRLLLPALFIALIFSPGVNVVLLILVILLGVAENWAPFRASALSGANQGPPPTPEA